MKKMWSMKRRLASLAAVLLAVAVGSAVAQGPPRGAPPGPDPGLAQGSPEELQGSLEEQPGVGRISLIQGNVSTQHGDSGEWVAVTPNTPLAPGDSISTGPGSRAEVQLDYANVLRLSEGASAKIVTLAPNQIQIQVGQGLVNYSVVRPGEAAIEIDTPNVAIHPLGAGSYRIQVNSDAETQVIVRNGAADVSTPQGSTRVETGQLITIQGTDNPQYQTVSASGPDGWDRWTSDRDRLITNAEGVRRTTPYYVGAQDLDSNGSWSNDSEYGNVWTPAQAQDPGWAPYRDGRWVLEPYYGWTWVSYEPWGWAPYHYGRWFLRGSSWAWWPGPIGLYPGYRPLWSPAYVSFFGFGGRGGVSFGVGFGFGNVGWLPIGPGDHFFPWYGRFGGRGNFANITNIYNGRGFNYGGLHGIGPLAGHGFSNMHEAFRNDGVRAGMTSMAGNQFGRGGVPIHQQPISAASLRQGTLMTGGLGMSPSRESYRPTGRAANPASIPARGVNSQRSFSDSRASAASRPLGGQAAQANPGLNARTNPGSNAGQNGRAFGAANPGANTSAGNRTTPQSGWRSFGPGNQGNSAQGLGPARGQNPAAGTRPGASASPSFPSRPAPSYSGGRQGGGSYGSSRPPLDMRQSIVTPRGSSSGYNGPRYSAPSGVYGGGSGYPGGSSDGGRSYSAPSRSGGGVYGGGGGYRGGSSGGGGSYSAPSRSGGGGRSGGGHSSGRGR